MIQSFLHLYFTPNYCGNFPDNYTLHLLQTKVFLLSRSRQNDLIVLEPCDSQVKHSDLHLEEQGCERGPEKTETQRVVLNIYTTHTHTHCVYCICKIILHDTREIMSQIL